VVRLKTFEEIEKMRPAGRMVRRVLDSLGEMLAPGVTTEELDREAERICRGPRNPVPAAGSPW